MRVRSVEVDEMRLLELPEQAGAKGGCISIENVVVLQRDEADGMREEGVGRSSSWWLEMARSHCHPRVHRQGHLCMVLRNDPSTCGKDEMDLRICTPCCGLKRVSLVAVYARSMMTHISCTRS